MEQELSSYDYLFVGGPNYIYTLKTRFEAEYEIKFKPSGYLVDKPEFEALVFDMVIVLTNNPYEPRLPPVDALMSATIRSIVADFFKAHERVVIYICDDSDSKADSRRKLFDRWFGRYKTEIFVKLNVPLGIDEDGMAYSVELISRFDNPHFMPIYESFKRTVSGEK
ncbi:hypothetical protein EXU85_27875 [Spirosoma sp. KCTC 42546]|uniref:DUF6169 family protein n=1 Tax=Spirosoma sp. KCTC 42546 TaxID=2520506 RepID=UPI001158647E|nr:DUF6169 family protein [Spirosoma sp. KCTC 42546]QDK82223.1 hypothetical protein EXU85_27875 [Spirosoma sp. KCTC 42546]